MNHYNWLKKCQIISIGYALRHLCVVGIGMGTVKAIVGLSVFHAHRKWLTKQYIICISGLGDAKSSKCGLLDF